jgi:hypothetical protein
VTATTKLSRVHWDSIVRGIKRDQCVPFLGAGVNAGTSLPMGAEVAIQLLNRLLDKQIEDWSDLIEVTPTALLAGYPDLTRARVQDLARVASHLELEGGYPAVVDYLKDIILDEGQEPSQILRVLARLPIRLIVTTNYDRLLERSFSLENQPSPQVLSQKIGGFASAEMTEWQSRLAGPDRVIYKLHGSFDDDSPNLVISEDDYIDFLAIMANENVGVPRQIRAAIKTSVVLFLGYGLEDWDVRSIYSLLIGSKEQRAQQKSFAIQRDPSPFWVRFWEQKNVIIYNIDLDTFAGQFEAEYAKRTP